MHLFAPVKPMFSTKVAAIPLDEDPTKWSSQILRELYRTVPETSEYNPQIVMLREDPEQGFALGVVVISGQTDSALSAAGNDQPTSKRAMIPIIIKNNELCPLDLVMTADKKMLPLTGGRLREALFRPNTFDMMTDDSSDQSLYSLFYPPGRASNSPSSGFSAGAGDNVGYVYGPGFKMSSDRAFQKSMMATILPTLSQNDLDMLGEKLSSLGLVPQIQSNPAFAAVMAKVSEYDGRLMRNGDPEILMDKAASLAGVDVAQFGWNASEGYWVKQASRSLYALHQNPVTRGELLKLAGPEMVSKVDTEGTVTVSDPVKDPAPLSTTAEHWEEITKPGVYKVKATDGTELTGWVLPGLMDFDGTSLPLTAFTNGTAATVQSEIVGSKITDSAVNLPEAPPTGNGLFYVASANTIEATVPFKIIGSEAAMDGSTVLHVISMTGLPHTLRFVEGLKAMVPGGDEVLMPRAARFLPLNKEAPVPLIDDLDSIKTSSFNQPHIAIRHGGDIVDLTFHQLPGLAASSPKVASVDDAVFTLCAAGLAPMQAHSLIKRAAMTMNTEYAMGVRDVRSVDTFMAPVEKSASEKVAAAHALRKDLLKEAAILPDIQTVDSVLSLGYINPENIRLFVGRLPYLEKALNTICELTLFSRLGMSEIPESASARAARALDEVIQALKGLGLRAVDSMAAATQR